MIFVRGRRKNLVSVGWENHVLQIEFCGGRRYQYGGVPVEVKDKLLRSPYPDNLFRQIVLGKYVSERVDLPPAKPVARYQSDLEDLPF
jgi:hypothetical protein